MSGQIAFEHAGPHHEADIRTLLRDVALGGRWSIALAREPDGFAGPHLPGERQDFILARDTGSGEAIGLCERVVRPAYIGGRIVDLPYLGALRIAPSHRHRLSILRGGFAAVRQHCEASQDFPVALTSITSDNSPARRVLTAGLRGFPTYAPLADYATLALRPAKAPHDPDIARSEAQDLEEIAAFLRERLSHRDAAPVWTAEALAKLGGARFLVLREAGRITGAVSVWDQRESRQTILLDAPSWAKAIRRPVNLLGSAIGYPRLPQVGQALDQVFLSHLATQDDCERRAIRLVRTGLGEIRRLRAGSAVVGLPVAHPWREAIRSSFRTIEYRTSLFGVYWPGNEKYVEQIDAERLFPEVGLL